MTQLKTNQVPQLMENPKYIPTPPFPFFENTAVRLIFVGSFPNIIPPLVSVVVEKTFNTAVTSNFSDMVPSLLLLEKKNQPTRPMTQLKSSPKTNDSIKKSSSKTNDSTKKKSRASTKK